MLYDRKKTFGSFCRLNWAYQWVTGKHRTVSHLKRFVPIFWNCWTVPLFRITVIHTDILTRYDGWINNSISVNEQMGLNVSGSLGSVATNTCLSSKQYNTYFYSSVMDGSVWLMEHRDHPPRLKEDHDTPRVITCFHNQWLLGRRHIW